MGSKYEDTNDLLEKLIDGLKICNKYHDLAQMTFDQRVELTLQISKVDTELVAMLKSMEVAVRNSRLDQNGQT